MFDTNDIQRVDLLSQKVPFFHSHFSGHNHSLTAMCIAVNVLFYARIKLTKRKIYLTDTFIQTIHNDRIFFPLGHLLNESRASKIVCSERNVLRMEEGGKQSST